MKIAVIFPVYFDKNFFRDGIIRHLSFVIKSMLKHQQEVNFEIWSFKKENLILKEYFEDKIETHLINRIKFQIMEVSTQNRSLFTETLSGKIGLKPAKQEIIKQYKNIKTHDIIKLTIARISYKLIKFFSSIIRVNPQSIISRLSHFRSSNEIQSAISKLNKISDADLFYHYFSLDYLEMINKKPSLLIIHDMMTFSYLELFKSRHGLFRWDIYNRRFLDRSRRIIGAGAKILAISEVILEREIKIFLRPRAEQIAGVIYTPLISNGSEILERGDFYARLGFPEDLRYITYPTVSRPNKNIPLLIESIGVLRGEGIHLRCVFTWDIRRGDRILSQRIRSLGIGDLLIYRENLSEEELFNLYYHAFLTVIPTFTEGNFPLQAMESWEAGTPVILSDNPLVEDRFRFLGVDMDDKLRSDLNLFSPLSVEQLVEKLKYAMFRGKRYLYDLQLPYFNRLLEYDSEDFALEYLKVFRKVISESGA